METSDSDGIRFDVEIRIVRNTSGDLPKSRRQPVTLNVESRQKKKLTVASMKAEVISFVGG